MNKKITLMEVAKTFGYSDNRAFYSWKSEERKARFEWLRVSAILIKNGINYFTVLGLAEENIRLKEKIKEYESKMELLKGIRDEKERTKSNN